MTRRTVKHLRHKRTFVDDFWDTWDKVVDKLTCDKNKKKSVSFKKVKCKNTAIVGEIQKREDSVAESKKMKSMRFSIVGKSRKVIPRHLQAVSLKKDEGTTEEQDGIDEDVVQKDEYSISETKMKKSTKSSSAVRSHKVIPRHSQRVSLKTYEGTTEEQDGNDANEVQKDEESTSETKTSTRSSIAVRSHKVIPRHLQRVSLKTYEGTTEEQDGNDANEVQKDEESTSETKTSTRSSSAVRSHKVIPRHSQRVSLKKYEGTMEEQDGNDADEVQKDEDLISETETSTRSSIAVRSHKVIPRHSQRVSLKTYEGTMEEQDGNDADEVQKDEDLISETKTKKSTRSSSAVRSHKVIPRHSQRVSLKTYEGTMEEQDGNDADEVQKDEDLISETKTKKSTRSSSAVRSHKVIPRHSQRVSSKKYEGTMEEQDGNDADEVQKDEDSISETETSTRSSIAVRSHKVIPRHSQRVSLKTYEGTMEEQDGNDADEVQKDEYSISETKMKKSTKSSSAVRSHKVIPRHSQRVSSKTYEGTMEEQDGNDADEVQKDEDSISETETSTRSSIAVRSHKVIPRHSQRVSLKTYEGTMEEQDGNDADEVQKDEDSISETKTKKSTKLIIAVMSHKGIPNSSDELPVKKDVGTMAKECGYEISSCEMICYEMNDNDQKEQTAYQAYRDMVGCITKKQEKASVDKLTKELTCHNNEAKKEQGTFTKEIKKAARFAPNINTKEKIAVKNSESIKTKFKSDSEPINKTSNSRIIKIEKSKYISSPSQTHSTDSCATCNERKMLKVTDHSTQYEEFRSLDVKSSSKDLLSYSSLEKYIYASTPVQIENEQLSEESADHSLLGISSRDKPFSNTYNTYKEAYKSCYKNLPKSPSSRNCEVNNCQEGITTVQPKLCCNKTSVEFYQKQLAKAYRNSVSPSRSPELSSERVVRRRSPDRLRIAERTRSAERSMNPEKQKDSTSQKGISTRGFYSAANVNAIFIPNNETNFKFYSSPKEIRESCLSSRGRCSVKEQSPFRYVYPENARINSIKRSLSPCRNRLLTQMPFSNYYCSVAAMRGLPVLRSPEPSMTFHTAQSAASHRGCYISSVGKI